MRLCEELHEAVVHQVLVLVDQLQTHVLGAHRRRAAQLQPSHVQHVIHMYTSDTCTSTTRPKNL